VPDLDVSEEVFPESPPQADGEAADIAEDAEQASSDSNGQEGQPSADGT
jgi:hypothetical protein